MTHFVREQWGTHWFADSQIRWFADSPQPFHKPLPLKNPIHIRPGTTGWVLIVLPYTPERVAKIKTLSDRQWLDQHKCWAIPRTARTIERLKALFAGDQIVVAPELLGPKPAHIGQHPPIHVPLGSAQETLCGFVAKLQNRAYSPHTIDIYDLHVRRFLKTIKKSPHIVEPADIQRYLHTMHTREKRAETYCYQAIRAIKAFLSLELNKTPDFIKMALPPRRTNTP